MNAPLPAAVTASAALLLTASVLAAQNAPIAPPRAQPAWESCEEMHDTYVQRFVSAEGFGLARMRSPVMIDRSGILDLGRTRYTIASLELIGLERREAPVVYVPRMHGMRPETLLATLRPPTEFESGALGALRAGRDIAIADGDPPGVMRCVGALRTQASCMRCHQEKKAGDLLGAFTYRLKAVTNRVPG
jgi:hypothetical protein